jgi:ATP-dependent helicase HrpB
MNLTFPIDSLKEKILTSLKEKDFLIIKSTPGSGKTTRVPLFLSEVFSKKIYILEPRKLAAKLASGFVAKSKNENPGQSVGHIFKYEKCVTDQTQIIFLTEGTFLRLLTSDPYLNNCDVVVLDEFHERHYQTDVALSFLLKIKEKNPKLKIIIMSATINLAELESLLKDRVNTLELNEVKHQLTVQHLPNDTLVLKEPLERKVLDALYKTKDRPGHSLIFLPGMSEIRKCEEALSGKFNAEIIILHGEIGGITIDDSFYNLKQKRIILSTNIAESSVTIPGVRTVIDSGLHRTSRLNPVTRLPLIELKKTSQSSAIQRAHRASREDDGLALRLYAELDFQSRPQFDVPEIKRTDLSELILRSAELYKAKINELCFVTKLDESEINKSQNYLEQVGLIENGEPTKIAFAISKTPFHPRIAKVLSEAEKGSMESFKTIVKYLAEMIEPQRTDRFVNLARQYFKATNGPEVELEKAMLFGYVDQISKLKGHDHVVHMNGETLTISHSIKDQIDPNHSLWIVLNLDNKNHVTRMLPIEEDWLYELPHFPIEEDESIDFDPENFRLKTERISKVGGIILSREKVSNDHLSEKVLSLVVRKLDPVFRVKLNTEMFNRMLVLEKYTQRKIEEFNSDDWLKSQLSFLLSGSYSWEQLIENYANEVFAFLNEAMIFDLEKDLPLFLQLHDKRKVPLHYDSSNGIHCQSYIQDFYGLTSAPVILKGKEKIKIHLLGPHKRPLQVTQDLMSFWERTYKELMGELKRDYPRHYWPENPEKAKPILLTKNVM